MPKESLQSEKIDMHGASTLCCIVAAGDETGPRSIESPPA